MIRWNIVTNDYFFTSSVILEKAPWYIFTIEFCIQWICYFIPQIPLPRVKIKINNEETNLKDYYGTVADLFHIYICSPITQWCFRKIKSDSIYFPYKELERMFPEKFKSEKELLFTEEETKENKEYSEIIGEEFLAAYKKLQQINLQ